MAFSASTRRLPPWIPEEEICQILLIFWLFKSLIRHLHRSDLSGFMFSKNKSLENSCVRYYFIHSVHSSILQKNSCLLIYVLIYVYCLQ